MPYEITSTPVEAFGYSFRSKLEYEWAKKFQAMGCEWDYVDRHTCDFVVSLSSPSVFNGLHVEVKPSDREIALAGAYRWLKSSGSTRDLLLLSGNPGDRFESLLFIRLNCNRCALAFPFCVSHWTVHDSSNAGWIHGLICVRHGDFETRRSEAETEARGKDWITYVSADGVLNANTTNTTEMPWTWVNGEWQRDFGRTSIRRPKLKRCNHGRHG